MKLISIFPIQRKNKKIYHAEYEYNGRIHRKSLNVSSKDEAFKMWNEIINSFKAENEKLKFEENLFSVTIEKGIDEYLNYREKTVQHSTFNRDKTNIYRIKKFLEESEIKIVKEISEDTFKKYYTMLDNQNLSPKTINNYISTLSNIFKYFKGRNYISPFTIIDLSKYWKKRKKEKIKIINKNDARIIVDEFKKIKDIEKKAYMLIPFFTGLRLSEVKGLNRKNIDMEKKFITVCEKWTHYTDFPESILKSSAGYRKVPIMSEYFPILNEYLKKIDKEYIFENLSHSRVKVYFRKIKNIYNLDMNYHQARHFFASLLIDSKKFSMKEIQGFLGHENVQTLMDTYGHIIQDLDITSFDNINF